MIATHDVDRALDYTDRVVVMAEGVIAEDGASRDVLARPTHAATRELLRSERERAGGLAPFAMSRLGQLYSIGRSDGGSWFRIEEDPSLHR